jgi:hypothetical protein
MLFIFIVIHTTSQVMPYNIVGSAPLSSELPADGTASSLAWSPSVFSRGTFVDAPSLCHTIRLTRRRGHAPSTVCITHAAMGTMIENDVAPTPKGQGLRRSGDVHNACFPKRFRARLAIFWSDGLCIELSPIQACPRVGAPPQHPFGHPPPSHIPP